MRGRESNISTRMAGREGRGGGGGNYNCRAASVSEQREADNRSLFEILRYLYIIQVDDEDVEKDCRCVQVGKRL